MWSLVIFDFDGTLMDTEGSIVWAMQATVEKLGLTPEFTQQWRELIGLSLEAQARQLLPLGTPEDWQQLTDTYRHFYSQVLISHSVPFAGAEELLKQLEFNGIKLAIASSKRRWAIEKILAYLGWAINFAPIITPTEVTYPKPHRESVDVILDYHQVPRESVIFIGDSTFDIEAACQGEIASCGVGWGVHTQTALEAAGATYYVEDMQSLRALLLPTES